jgi:hypothetical protein
MAFTFILTLPFLGVVCLVYYVTTASLAWYRLRRFSGPFFASFSDLPLLQIDRSGRSNELLASLNAQYGPLARIGPGDLITDDPALIRRMSAARSPYTRSTWCSKGSHIYRLRTCMLLTEGLANLDQSNKGVLTVHNLQVLTACSLIPCIGSTDLSQTIS